jgi:hypothetical protein
MRLLISLGVLGLLLASSVPPSTEAPTGFDDKSNGVTDDATHQADQTKSRKSSSQAMASDRTAL